MEYVIYAKNKKSKVLYYKKDVDGLEIKPNSRSFSINVDKMLLTDPDLINEYISVRLEKKFKSIITKLYEILNDEDASENDTSMLLDETEKFKEIVNNKYARFLSIEKKREFLAKIILIEEELKKKYMEIKYINDLINTKEYTFEEPTRTVGRKL